MGSFLISIRGLSSRPSATSRKLTSYLGLIPAEDSSGGKQPLGHLTKQGNALLRGLLNADLVIQVKGSCAT
jgi:transposase